MMNLQYPDPRLPPNLNPQYCLRMGPSPEPQTGTNAMAKAFLNYAEVRAANSVVLEKRDVYIGLTLNGVEEFCLFDIGILA